METPNTRSRRKRELMESAPSGGLQEDYGRIDWVHDTRLRRMVLAATQNGMSIVHSRHDTMTWSLRDL
jgi:hypothetical protein